jgi:hypothetical protein
MTEAFYGSTINTCGLGRSIANFLSLSGMYTYRRASGIVELYFEPKSNGVKYYQPLSVAGRMESAGVRNLWDGPAKLVLIAVTLSNKEIAMI